VLRACRCEEWEGCLLERGSVRGRGVARLCPPCEFTREAGGFRERSTSTPRWHGRHARATPLLLVPAGAPGPELQRAELDAQQVQFLSRGQVGLGGRNELTDRAQQLFLCRSFSVTTDAALRN